MLSKQATAAAMWAICLCVATLKSGSTAVGKWQRQTLPVSTISNGWLAGRVAWFAESGLMR